MAQCRKCDKDITQPKEGCKCADCNGVFHLVCVSDTVKKRGAQKNWKCEDCVFDPSTMTSKPGGDRNNSNQPVLEAIAALRTEMVSRWDTNDVKLDKMQNDIKGINSEINTLKLEFNDVKIQGKTTEKQVEQLAAENKRLSVELVTVKRDLEDLQQYSRVNNIIITGIPRLPRCADVLAILEVIAHKINVPFFRSDINASHWLPVRDKDNRTQSIIVSFVSRLVKNEWLSARRLKKSLKASELNDRFPSTQVYINEQLTQQNRALFNAARAAMKDGKLTSVWTSDGRVMVKRSPADRPIRVISLQDQVLQSPPPQGATPAVLKPPASAPAPSQQLITATTKHPQEDVNVHAPSEHTS